jgi:hypothetical protein
LLIEDLQFTRLFLYGNLALPSFLGKKTQLSNVEVEYSRGLARIPIHVERILGATKKDSLF